MPDFNALFLTLLAYIWTTLGGWVGGWFSPSAAPTAKGLDWFHAMLMLWLVKEWFDSSKTHSALCEAQRALQEAQSAKTS